MTQKPPTEAQRRATAKRNIWANVNIHRPEHASRDLIKRCRIKCLLGGHDPGCTQSMTLAMIAVGQEDPRLQRGIFHPDYLCRTAGQWSYSWRVSSEKFQNRVIEEAKTMAVNCTQFEPLQPEKHDRTPSTFSDRSAIGPHGCD